MKRNKYVFDMESRLFLKSSTRFLSEFMEITNSNVSGLPTDRDVKYSLDVFVSNVKGYSDINNMSMLYSNTFDMCFDRTINYETLIEEYEEVLTVLQDCYDISYDFIIEKEEGLVINYLVFCVTRYSV